VVFRWLFENNRLEEKSIGIPTISQEIKSRCNRTISIMAENKAPRRPAESGTGYSGEGE
jgi:hypothetical protein